MGKEFEFEFEIKDWMAFQENHIENSKEFNRAKLLVTATVPIMLCIIGILELYKDKFTLFGFVIFLIVSILWVILMPKRFNTSTLKRAKKMMEEGNNSSLFGLHKIFIDEVGITHFTKDLEQKIKWNGIKKLAESETHFFLYNTAISAIIIPKQKVNSDLEELKAILVNNISQ